MGVSKKADSAGPGKTSLNDAHVVTMPRAWLIGLAALLIVPWVVVSAIYFLPGSPRIRRRACSRARGPIPRRAGWSRRRSRTWFDRCRRRSAAGCTRSSRSRRSTSTRRTRSASSVIRRTRGSRARSFRRRRGASSSRSSTATAGSCTSPTSSSFAIRSKILLPAFARNHLYRYPKLTAGDLNRSLLSTCLWSSLNFFAVEPEDRFLELNVALETLKRDYFIVESGFQLGDVVAFLDGDGDLFHVAVYLADGLVFSKNGTSPVSPWVIMPIDRLKDFYRSRSSSPRLIYHRHGRL